MPSPDDTDEAEDAVHVHPTLEEHVATQYSGARARLRPIFDAIAAVALELGDDVRAEGRSTHIHFLRARQFALVQPSTSARVDLWLRLDDPPHSPRLLPAKDLAEVTHRVELHSVDDVDVVVRGLLLTAYDQNG